jgi:predicted amidohydrolase YtcJ
LTGILENEAANVFQRLFMAASLKDYEDYATAALKVFASHGTTTFMDAAAIGPEPAAYGSIIKRSQMYVDGDLTQLRLMR